MESSKRIYFLDSLRSFVIFMVIFYHVTFMYVQPYQFFPFVRNTISDKNNVIFYILTILFNGETLNSAMFFIAGYFALAPLVKKGAGRFYKDKLVRLGIPYIVGFFLLVPVSKNIALTSWGYKVDNWYLACFYPENVSPLHFWFIGILLVFFSVLSLGFIVSKKRNTWGNTRAGDFPAYYAILFMALTIVMYFLVSLIVPASYFTNLYVINFQSVMLPVYAAYFLLGIYAFKRSWFNEGYKPEIIPWAVAYAVAIGIHLLLIFKSSVISAVTGQIALSLIMTTTYNVAIFSAIMALLALFRKYVNGGSRFWSGISRSSYATYIIHYIIVFALIYATRDVPIPQTVRYTAQLVVAAALSFGAGYALKKTPVLNRVV